MVDVYVNARFVGHVEDGNAFVENIKELSKIIKTRQKSIKICQDRCGRGQGVQQTHTK